MCERSASSASVGPSGVLQVLWKHRKRQPERSNRYRRAVIVNNVVDLALVLTTPVVDFLAVLMVLAGDGSGLLRLAAWTLFVQGFSTAIGARLDGERLRSLWYLPAQVVVYSLLLVPRAADLVGLGRDRTARELEQARSAGDAARHRRARPSVMKEHTHVDSLTNASHDHRPDRPCARWPLRRQQDRNRRPGSSESMSPASRSGRSSSTTSAVAVERSVWSGSLAGSSSCFSP